ncbi:pyridoxamine 5'-phosphate oxidase family protein [Alkalicoccus halolimnae]|jgi:uncharacterized pyridoxamine 5'-phosphate oxidase family protein|uniref:Pyridoxamine 5'-phosphate oxidase family protein n=1 Tax=Alkalicoccus halolimnae TaxID=1667239 RepID=A0A5C7FDY0_9BACI|nr:pyridoxamine 5'-phosphate oxidase family protein [Alkalicoccus halolimnae]TXF83292.1 pyridoxamine 5'-phosphate oxidase family protein [Alkalicoccus halolimnae]
MEIYKRGTNLDLDEFLKKPLFAHLATSVEDAPRDSPVWFYWDGEKIWIVGTSSDTFPEKIKNNPKCAIGIVDFNYRSGLVIHIGFRGRAEVKPFDEKTADEIFVRYLGKNKEHWDPRFKGLDNSNVLICFTPESVVVRDQSFTPSSHMENKSSV